MMLREPLTVTRDGQDMTPIRGGVCHRTQWAVDPLGGWVPQRFAALTASAGVDLEVGDVLTGPSGTFRVVHIRSRQVLTVADMEGC